MNRNSLVFVVSLDCAVGLAIVKLILMLSLEFAASGSDIVKLYDLTTLCEEAEEEKCQNPFTLPVAVLLYKYVCETNQYIEEMERFNVLVKMYILDGKDV